MMSLFLKTFYAPILIGIVIAISVFFIGFYIVKRFYQTKPPVVVDAIAGDNVWSTKLDLARAYLEIDQAPLAKSVILEVIEQGDRYHRAEASQLLKEHF